MYDIARDGNITHWCSGGKKHMVYLIYIAYCTTFIRIFFNGHHIVISLIGDWGILIYVVDKTLLHACSIKTIIIIILCAIRAKNWKKK